MGLRSCLGSGKDRNVRKDLPKARDYVLEFPEKEGVPYPVERIQISKSGDWLMVFTNDWLGLLHAQSDEAQALAIVVDASDGKRGYGLIAVLLGGHRFGCEVQVDKQVHKWYYWDDASKVLCISDAEKKSGTGAVGLISIEDMGFTDTKSQRERAKPI